MRLQLLLLWIVIGFNSIAQTISTNPISGSYCQGNSISVSFTATGTFNTGNSFILQMSDAAGTFDNPLDIGIIYGTTSGTIIGTLPASVTTGSSYLFRVISSLPNVIGTDNGTGVNINGVLTDPMTFGNNQWFVHAYNGYNLTTSALPYLGYYTDGNLNINTATNWPILESPSSAAGFNGCFVPYDNHTVSFRRRGFPCDYYTINISALDNNSGRLLINGTQVWTSGAIGNVWSGFLGPNSRVELIYRESTGNSRAVVNFNTPNFPVLSGNMITCPNNNFNIVASGAPNYTWTSAPYAVSGTNAATLTVNAPIGASGTTETYTVTTNDTTGCSSTNSVNVTFSNLPLTTVTPTTDAICLGGNTVAVASGADAYSWSPTTGVSNPTGSNVTITPSATTTYTVTGTTCGATASATLTINVASPVGDTSLFGNNVWNAYCYNGSDLNTNLTSYAGFYVDNVLSFDSNTKWPTATTPSNAAGYTGCYVETDFHTVKYKRKGFPCGYYSFNVGSIDNVARLIVDGVTVWASPTATGIVYNGFLGPTSEVILVWRETTGNSRARLTLTNTNFPTIISTAVNVCAGSSVTLDASNGPNYQWVTNFTHTTGPYNTNTLTVSPPLGTPNSTQTYTVVSTDAVTGCTDSNKVVVTINPVLTVNVTPTTGNTCAAGFINATASGASTYTWSPMTGVILNNASGSSVTLNPPTSTVYTVTGSNGCNTSSKTVTITVPSGLGDTTVYGNYSWNVYAYNGTNANMNLNNYKGYYTVNGMSFESDDSFALNSNPSTAPGYQGCPVSNDNHSVQYKRQGFPCGYYRIGAVGVGGLVGYDNTAKLKINGVTVWNSPTAPINNVWQGFLGPNSRVDYIWVELTGNSVGRLTFTPIPYPTTSPDVTINSGTSTTLTASGAPNYDWNHNTTFTSGPYNNNSLTVTVPDGTPSQTQVYTVTAFDAGTNCTISSTVNVNIVYVDPLPVELISFEAYCVNEKTNFKWSTASERNNAYFEIETSNDGQTYYPKTKIQGVGNANFINNYEVTYTTNDLYVRLTQTDFDGKKTIYNPISLPNCNGTEKIDLLIYPNPNQGIFNLVYTGNKSQIEDVKIMDAAGKIVYNSNTLNDQIDIANLENGFYQIIVTQAKGITHKSFVKN